MTTQPTANPNLYPTEQTLDQVRRRIMFRDSPFYQSWLDGKFVSEDEGPLTSRHDMLVSVSVKNRMKRNCMPSRRYAFAHGVFGFEDGSGIGKKTLDTAVEAINAENHYDEPLLERPTIFDIVSLGVDPTVIGYRNNSRLAEVSALAEDVEFTRGNHRYQRFERAYGMASKILEEVLLGTPAEQE